MSEVVEARAAAAAAACSSATLVPPDAPPRPYSECILASAIRRLSKHAITNKIRVENIIASCECVTDRGEWRIAEG